MNTPKRKAFEPLNLNSSAKRARINLSLDQKRSICKYHRENPKASHEAIAKHFTTFFNLEKQIGRSTISDIVRNKENWEGANNDWSINCLNDSSAHHITISDEMYIEQALKIGDDIEVNRQEFNYSKDASEDVDESELKSGRTTLNDNDRFILDKLAIIFCLQSSKTSSSKKSEDDIKSESAEELQEGDTPEDIACKLFKQKETIEFSVERTQNENSKEDNDFEKDEYHLTKLIDTTEALVYINQLETFFLNSPFTVENDIEIVVKLRSRIEVINEQS